MILPLMLLAAASGQLDEPQMKVSYALTLLNNAIEAIGVSDACLHRSDMRTLEPLADRIQAARDRAVSAVPALAGMEQAGDTDFICNTSPKPNNPSGRAIRGAITRLLIGLENALPQDTATVR